MDDLQGARARNAAVVAEESLLLSEQLHLKELNLIGYITMCIVQYVLKICDPLLALGVWHLCEVYRNEAFL